MAQLSKTQLSILKALASHSGPAPIHLIAEAHGDNAERDINELVQTGLIANTGTACAITDIGRAALAPTGNAILAAAPPAKPGTKRALLLKRLTTHKGRTITQLAQIMGWLPHTTRAALTRLRQAGYEVQRVPADGKGKPTRYRLMLEAQA